MGKLNLKRPIANEENSKMERFEKDLEFFLFFKTVIIKVKILNKNIFPKFVKSFEGSKCRKPILIPIKPKAKLTWPSLKT